jgi:hypothetical protein
MATGQKRGKLSRIIAVTTNDRSSQSVNLECEAEILSALKCDPENVNFGQIKRSDTRAEKTVKITRGNGGPIKPKVVSSGNPQVTADLREVEPGESYELAIVTEPPWPNGMLRANVQIETGVEQAPTESIMVFANVAPRVQASPQRFTIRPDSTTDSKVVARLNWDDDHPGKITDVTVNDSTLSVAVEEQNNQQVIVLDVPAGYSPSRSAGTQVSVKTDDPAVPSIQIPVFAMAARVAGPAGPTTGPSVGPDRARVNPAMLRARAKDIETTPTPSATSRPVGSGPPK